MGVCDDGPYILMAHTLASHRPHRLQRLGRPHARLAALPRRRLHQALRLLLHHRPHEHPARRHALAFVLQRTLVRANITERNATIGTLAFVLSPLYLMLSVTFMTDITGLFAIVLCLYGCLRALQSSTNRSTIAWLCFAVATNALCGTSRQIAWLGVLVMVPSTLWLLRSQRHVLLAGAAATLAGALFIFACMHWLKHQPYTIPEHLCSQPPSLSPTPYRSSSTPSWTFPSFCFPSCSCSSRRSARAASRHRCILCVICLGYLFLAVSLPATSRGIFLLEPTVGDWVTLHAMHP